VRAGGGRMSIGRFGMEFSRLVIVSLSHCVLLRFGRSSISCIWSVPPRYGSCCAIGYKNWRREFHPQKKPGEQFRPAIANQTPDTDR
jgi:hypothetical protein